MTRRRLLRIAQFVLPLFLALAPLPRAGAQQGGWDQILGDFSQRIAGEVLRDGAGGLTVGVFAGRDLVWARGFGWADIERRIPAGVNTIYRIGSISKSFTAVALLQLWQQGVVDLDEPVQSVLPEMGLLRDKPAGSLDVTWRHLASHTSGLIREPELDGAAEGPLEFWEEKILASIPATSFFAAPGEAYRYSNIGFGMLGYALGRASGIPFMELVDGGLIRPLGMHSTGFVVTPAIAEQLATGYLVRPDGTAEPEIPYLEHVGRGYKIPNGGIYSTVGDLGRFAAGLTGAATVPILGPEAQAQLVTVQTPADSPTRYSFGFFLYQREGAADLVGHSGSVAGYNAFLVFEPESSVGVVLLRNYGGGETNLGASARELLWRLLEAR